MPSATILPQGPSRSDAHQVSPALSQAPTLISKVIGMWEAVQINNRGKYSTARMEALHNYCRQTSLARALAVCILTPLPSLLTLIAVECLPLGDPADGWRANYAVWLRLFVIIMTAAAGSVFQIRGMATGLSLNWRTVIGIGIGTAVGSTLVNLTCAVLLVFPLPYGLILTTVPFQIFFLPLFRVATRHQDLSRFRGVVKGAVLLILVQSIMAFVYTAFSSVFAYCTPAQQTALILLLSVIKVGMKNLVAWMSSYNQDTIPVVVVFTAELFNALYVSICMQLAISGWTSAVVIALDAAQAAFSLMEIYYTTSEIRANGCKKAGRAPSILSTVLRKRTSRSVSPNIATSNKQSSTCGTLHGPAATFVTNQTDTRPAHVSQRKRSDTSSATKMMDETRKLVFHSEYLMLVEYIECAIPALYAVYLIALAHLPSADYYPHARSLSSGNLWSTVSGLALYAVLESLALMGLHTVLKRLFGFSPIQQLAFVLETDMEQVQGRLFVWVIALPQFTLVHFGADPTFRFEWIQSQTSS